jgi:uncharacterized RDD family membrane protein YckC
MRAVERREKEPGNRIQEEPGYQTWPSESGRRARYPGEALGLPERGPGSLARMGRRLAALAVDWLVAYGLAALGMTLGLVTPALLATAVMVVWFLVGAVAVRLFGFTPGQFALGLVVLPVAAGTGRPHVRLGRAVVRGVMIALVIPALFVDDDGRGLHDRLTGTAVVRR